MKVKKKIVFVAAKELVSQMAHGQIAAPIIQSVSVMGQGEVFANASLVQAMMLVKTQEKNAHVKMATLKHVFVVAVELAKMVFGQTVPMLLVV
jgi:adenine C2-methylase RlmN of 23S rRNA A2503 and tRNA A37